MKQTLVWAMGLGYGCDYNITKYLYVPIINDNDQRDINAGRL